MFVYSYPRAERSEHNEQPSERAPFAVTYTARNYRFLASYCGSKSSSTGPQRARQELVGIKKKNMKKETHTQKQQHKLRIFAAQLQLQFSLPHVTYLFVALSLAAVCFLFTFRFAQHLRMQLHFAAAMLSMPDFSARRLITTTYYYHHPSPASAALKLKNYGQKISALELCSAMLLSLCWYCCCCCGWGRRSLTCNFCSCVWELFALVD